MAEQDAVPVVLCMGSSCFSRGNNRNIEIVQKFAADRGLAVRIDARGHLCEGQCKSGPNVVIDDKLYHEVDPVALTGLLNFHVAKRQG